MPEFTIRLQDFVDPENQRSGVILSGGFSHPPPPQGSVPFNELTSAQQVGTCILLFLSKELNVPIPELMVTEPNTPVCSICNHEIAGDEYLMRQGEPVCFDCVENVPCDNQCRGL